MNAPQVGGEMGELQREWQAQRAAGISSRSFEDFCAVRFALCEMAAVSGLFVSKFTFTGYERGLARYPVATAVQTLRLVHMIAAGGRPVLLDAERMAERIAARGYRAVEKAAYAWARGRKKDSTGPLSTPEWIDAVEAAFKLVGNPDLPPPAALLPEETSAPTPQCEKSEQQRQRAEQLIAAGHEPSAAWCKAALEVIDATPIANKSIPARRRRRLA